MADEVKRLNYFDHQFLREKDFNEEQEYHVTHQRDHARLLHTAGIAEGLDIPDPASGATAVTINAGVAYDSQGRRIVLANNYTLELKDETAGADLYVTLAYNEAQSDPTNETGITGNTRWTETPLIDTSEDLPANQDEKLVLGLIVRTGTTIDSVDASNRRYAGVKGGDLAVRSLTFTSDSVSPPGWVKADLSVSGRADIHGALRVTNNLTVNGTITGKLAPNSVETGEINDGAVTLQKLAPAAQPIISIDGVSNPGGNIDLVPGGGITITPDNTNKRITISDNHSVLTNNPHATTAAQVGALVSVDGVTNAGGNIDLVNAGAVTITPDNSNKRITIGENHSTKTDNPHATTAAQVGALPLSGGILSGDLRVTGNVGINVAPSTRLHVTGSSPAVRIADGTQGAGRTLISDASGNATWRDNSRYFVSSSLNNASVNASTTPVRLGDYLTFTKASVESTVEVTLNSRARAGTFSGASGVIFEIRMDNAVTSMANKAAITTSGAIEYIGIFAVFQGLSAGAHTVSVWVQANAGSSTAVMLDPGGWGGRILVKETF